MVSIEPVQAKTYSEVILAWEDDPTRVLCDGRVSKGDKEPPLYYYWRYGRISIVPKANSTSLLIVRGKGQADTIQLRMGDTVIAGCYLPPPIPNALQEIQSSGKDTVKFLVQDYRDTSTRRKGSGPLTQSDVPPPKDSDVY